jgi:hypothetical protein
MPYTPIRGFDGTVKQGAGPTALLAVTDWEADIDVEITKQGPFLNDSGTTYKVRGGKDCKGKIKANVPDGKDSNQTAVVNALLNGTDINLVLTQGVPGAGTGGYVLTVPTAIVSKIKPGQDSKGGATIEFEFESSGSFTFA